jgi:hypothetical protein
MPTGFTTGLSEIPRNFHLEAKIVSLKAEGLTYVEIGRIVNRSASRVQQIYHRHLGFVEQSEVYQLWHLVMLLWPPQK